MNQQTFFSPMLKRTFLILALAPWMAVAACGPGTNQSEANQSEADQPEADQPDAATPDKPQMDPNVTRDCMAAANGQLQSFATVDDIKAAITNKWAYCSGEPANFKEITEFTADSHWYTLVRDADGQLVRKGGFFSSGTYEINIQGSAPWSYANINLYYSDANSTLTTDLAFLDMPLVMRNGPGIYVPVR